MNKFFSFLVFLAVSTVATSQENHMQLIRPKAAELKLLQLKNDNVELFAKFKGKTWIFGTFIGEWPEKIEGEEEIFDPQYLIVPNATSLAKLPYFRFKDEKYNNHYRVKIIDLENGETALKLAANKKEAYRFLQHQINKIQITGKFLIESYIVGVDCDAPWARANVVKFQKPSKPSSNLKSPDGC